jgi:hypothetical protein
VFRVHVCSARECVWSWHIHDSCVAYHGADPQEAYPLRFSGKLAGDSHAEHACCCSLSLFRFYVRVRLHLARIISVYASRHKSY